MIALDLPPFGRSGDPPADRRLIDFYKRHLPELLERLELERVTLLGHSLGGAIALHLALARPELVERLGLVAPAGLGSAPPWWWHLLSGYPPGAWCGAPEPVHPQPCARAYGASSTRASSTTRASSRTTYPQIELPARFNRLLGQWIEATARTPPRSLRAA